MRPDERRIPPREGRLARRLAASLASHAVRTSSSDRAAWCEAMVNELDHIPADAHALRWALGCLFVSYSERVRLMTRGSASLPSWLLALEMAVCLVPLTLLFVAVLMNVVHLPGMMQGHMRPADALQYLIGSLVGPAGLAVALRTIFVPSRPIGRATRVLLGALALWTLLAFTGQRVHDGTLLTAWREFLLIAVLPAVAVCHLIRISYERRTAIS